MKTVAAFTLGFGAGMVCLAVVLWNTGSIVTHAQVVRTVPETIQFKQLPLSYGDLFRRAHSLVIQRRLPVCRSALQFFSNDM